MSTTVAEKRTEVAAPIIQDRIAALPDDQLQRAQALEVLEKELVGNLNLVRDEQKKLMRDAIEQNMTPDEKVLAGISDRYALSSEYGVSREDFDVVLGEIRTNKTTLAQLRRLDTTGAEMTITSVTDGEIVFIDTVDNVNVEAQEEFLSGLDEKERSDAVSTLEQRFPKTKRLLQRADSDSGVNYYEYLLICEVTGAEPMPEAEYRTLQDRKPVDRQTICWLLTEQQMLDGGDALGGSRDDHEVHVDEVYVDEDYADFRYYFQAGRPLLRVQRT